MKIFLVLSVLFAIATSAPQVSLIGSTLVSSPLLARASPLIAPINPIATPLLAQVEGEAPASTVHAAHVKQVVVPQVIPQVISYNLPAQSPIHVISPYSLPAPIVSYY